MVSWFVDPFYRLGSRRVCHCRVAGRNTWHRHCKQAAVTTVELAALIGAVLGVGNLVAALVLARSSARKQDVEALTATIKALQDENTRLIKRSIDDRERIETLEEQVRALEAQVRKHGEKPVTESKSLWEKTHGKDRE